MTLDEQQAICDAASLAEYWHPEFRDVCFWKRPFDEKRELDDSAVKIALSWGHDEFLQSNWPQLPEPDGRGDLMVKDALFMWKARTEWPALIAEHRKALDEIERLKAAGKVLAENVSLQENWQDWDAIEKACKVFEEPK